MLFRSRQHHRLCRPAALRPRYQRLRHPRFAGHGLDQRSERIQSDCPTHHKWHESSCSVHLSNARWLHRPPFSPSRMLVASIIGYSVSLSSQRAENIRSQRPFFDHRLKRVWMTSTDRSALVSRAREYRLGSDKAPLQPTRGLMPPLI